MKDKKNKKRQSTKPYNKHKQSLRQIKYETAKKIEESDELLAVLRSTIIRPRDTETVEQEVPMVQERVDEQQKEQEKAEAMRMMSDLKF